ncbi:hypothetical protein N9A46_06200 [Candidatus Pelagibacter ubique]|nr:hypothetical protein [Candidatus Pelagibacter ubique]
MQQKWIKKGLLLKPDLKVEWMSKHLGPTFVLSRKNRYLDIFFSARNKKNISSIGMFTFDTKLKKKTNCKKIFSTSKSKLPDQHGVSYPVIYDFNKKSYLFYVGWKKNKKYKFENNLLLAVKKNNEFNRVKKIIDSKSSPFGSGSCYILKKDNMFYMWFTSFIKRNNKKKNNLNYEYVIKLAKSSDLINWKVKPGVSINFNSKKENAISKPSIIVKNSKYHMWYCYRGKNYKIGYAISTNGIKWQRRDKNVKFIGKDYKWDSNEKCYPSVINVGKKLYMIYSGNNYGKSGIGYSILK